MENKNDIIWLCNPIKNFNVEIIFEFLYKKCSPVQIDMILKNLPLIEDNMMLGYSEKYKDVAYIMTWDDEHKCEIREIRKTPNYEKSKN